MLRRLLFASALLLVSTTAFTSQAQAQTTTGTVEFSGVVGGACTFSNPVPGTLVLNSNDDSFLGSDSSNPDYAGGSAAEIDVNCTADATLSIDPPNATGDALPGSTLSANAKSSNLGLDFLSDGTFTNNSMTTGQQDTIQVNMLVDNAGNAINPGTYSYEVTLTATPL